MTEIPNVPQVAGVKFFTESGRIPSWDEDILLPDGMGYFSEGDFFLYSRAFPERIPTPLWWAYPALSEESELAWFRKQFYFDADTGSSFFENYAVSISTLYCNAVEIANTDDEDDLELFAYHHWVANGRKMKCLSDVATKDWG